MSDRFFREYHGERNASRNALTIHHLQLNTLAFRMCTKFIQSQYFAIMQISCRTKSFTERRSKNRKTAQIALMANEVVMETKRIIYSQCVCDKFIGLIIVNI